MCPEDVGHHMTTYPYQADADTLVSEAHKFMLETNIRHLPVTKGDRVLGLVTFSDLERARETNHGSDRIDQMMHASPYVVHSKDSLAHVCQAMAKGKHDSAIVLNSHDQIIGIFTTVDALQALSDLLNEEDANQKYNQYTIERFLPPLVQ